MKKERKEKHFIQKPTYPGGQQALKKFISENKRYPKEAFENDIEGVVRIKYDIDYKGNVVGTHVQMSLGHGCDEEAIRLVKMLKFDVSKTRKIKVLFHRTITIHFKKPKVKKKQVQLSYSYTTTKSPVKSSNPKRKVAYTYSIKTNNT